MNKRLLSKSASVNPAVGGQHAIHPAALQKTFIHPAVIS